MASKMKKISPKSCEYQTTMCGIKKWYQKMFEQLGWMVLAKHYRNDEKIWCYKRSVDELKQQLMCKIKSTNDFDKKQDLEIMLDNVHQLCKHIKKDFK